MNSKLIFCVMFFLTATIGQSGYCCEWVKSRPFGGPIAYNAVWGYTVPTYQPVVVYPPIMNPNYLVPAVPVIQQPVVVVQRPGWYSAGYNPYYFNYSHYYHYPVRAYYVDPY